MTFREVEKRIKNALQSFVSMDRYLLENNLNERAISHKLAGYIQNEFSDWDVDCEYNRNIDLVKKVKRVKILNDDTDANTVYPDIIVHHRNTMQNLLVIELKKNASESGKQDDIRKLNSFIKELNYQYGLFIDFKTGTESQGINLLVWLP